jgi:group I intron endonuclease
MERFKGIIYRATSPPGKMYYGMTLHVLEKRKLKHFQNTESGFTLPFNNAIRKYGIDNFLWEVVEKYEDDDKIKLINLLYDREIYWIAKDDTTNKENGYNISRGGSGSDIFSQLSPERQQEVRDTITSGLKKKWKDEEYRAKMIAHRSTDEYKKLKSDQAKKQWKNPETREKSMKSFRKNIWDNPERNEKIRQSLKNQPKYKCPYCGGEYTRGNYNRWHGENCKYK